MWDFFIEELENILEDELDLYSNIGMPFQISFQEPASPVMNGLLNLHDYVFFFILIILMVVLALLIEIVFFFALSNNTKYNFIFSKINPSSFFYNNLIRFYNILTLFYLALLSLVSFLIFVFKALFLIFSLKLKVKKWFLFKRHMDNTTDFISYLSKENLTYFNPIIETLLRKSKEKDTSFFDKNYIDSSFLNESSSFFTKIDGIISSLKKIHLENTVSILINDSFIIEQTKKAQIEHTLFNITGEENRSFISLEEFLLIFKMPIVNYENMKQQNNFIEMNNSKERLNNLNLINGIFFSQNGLESTTLEDPLISIGEFFTEIKDKEEFNLFSKKEKETAEIINRKIWWEGDFYNRRSSIFIMLTRLYYLELWMIIKNFKHLSYRGISIKRLFRGFRDAHKVPIFNNTFRFLKIDWNNCQLFSNTPYYSFDEFLNEFTEQKFVEENTSDWEEDTIYDFYEFKNNKDFVISLEEINNLILDKNSISNLINDKETSEESIIENDFNNILKKDTISNIIIDNIFYNLFSLKEYQESLISFLLYNLLNLSALKIKPNFFDLDKDILFEKEKKTFDVSRLFKKKPGTLIIVLPIIVEQMLSYYNFYLNNIFIFISSTMQRALRINYFNHSTRLEIIWTVIPIIIIAFIITPSFFFMYAIDEDMESLITIRVLGHQWYWSYVYAFPSYMLDESSIINMDVSLIPNERKYFAFDSYMNDNMTDGSPRLLATDTILVLPKYFHINCIVTSTDVLHSWALPSLGVKIDAVPGRLNRTDIFLEHEGMFFGQCSELCGVNHSFMPIQIESVSLTSFIRFISNF